MLRTIQENYSRILFKNWFVVSNIFHFPFSIWDSPSHWLSYFARWLVNDQPDVFGYDWLIFIDSSDVGMEMTHPEPERWFEWKIRAFRVSNWPCSFFQGTCDPFPDYHRNVQCSKRWLMMSWGSILPFIYWGWWEYKNGESPPASIILVGGLEHAFFSIYWE